jgi:hypothetical protein
MKMAKRRNRTTTSNDVQLTASESVSEMQQRVVALAEQVGRIAGSAQAKAHTWLDQPKVRQQLASIRDAAANLLERVEQQQEAPRPSRPAAGARSGGKVDAPGKKHRVPPPSARGVKHSYQEITKANAARQIRRGRQRQG